MPQILHWIRMTLRDHYQGKEEEAREAAEAKSNRDAEDVERASEWVEAEAKDKSKIVRIVAEVGLRLDGGGKAKAVERAMVWAEAEAT